MNDETERDEDDEADDEGDPVLALERNDLEGALALWLKGGLSGDQVRVLLLLQDDSGDELARRYAAARAKG